MTEGNDAGAGGHIYDAISMYGQERPIAEIALSA